MTILVHDKACFHCSASLSGGHRYKFCSDACAQATRTRKCEQCGFLFTNVNHAVRFCSVHCRGLAQQRNTTTCLTCGKKFCKPLRGRGPRKFCSNACHFRYRCPEWLPKKERDKEIKAAQAQRQKEKAKREAEQLANRPRCIKCTSPILGRGKVLLWCSPECRAQSLSFVCTHCGETFIGRPSQRNHSTKFCSKICLLNAQEATLKRIARRKYWHHSFRRRLADEKGWHCWICDESIDPSLKFPHAMSASIDHILPLALGGTNRRANLRPAHLICNALRGATPPPETIETNAFEMA